MVYHQANTHLQSDRSGSFQWLIQSLAMARTGDLLNLSPSWLNVTDVMSCQDKLTIPYFW